MLCELFKAHQFLVYYYFKLIHLNHFRSLFVTAHSESRTDARSVKARYKGHEL